jgi:hypothetical protein
MMTKTVLGVLCLLIIAVSSILFNNWSSTTYAQNDPNLIPWDENRLQFSDFQGVPDTFPDDYVGDRGDDFWAFTWTTTYYNWWPQITQNQPCMYTITAFDDNAYFYKNLSWVKSEHASDMSLLNHEQKHFDITEIQVRKTNEIVAAEFLGKQFACPSGQSQYDAINEKISQDLQSFLDQITQETNQMNLDYDAQTNHGMDPQMQKEWDDYITNLLDYYEPFKDKQETPLTQEEIEANFSQPPSPPIFTEDTSVYILENGTTPRGYSSWDEYCKAEYGDNSVYVPEENECTIAGGGCLIATATFGSELAPQVQFLREIRDNTVLSTTSGASFMTAFNEFYYSFSPTVADLERQNPVFKETVKVAITPLLSSLSLLQYVDINTESEMLGYGIGIILLNIGMYFVAPAILILKLKPILRTKQN